jgi:hypothetical protein
LFFLNLALSSTNQNVVVAGGVSAFFAPTCPVRLGAREIPRQTRAVVRGKGLIKIPERKEKVRRRKKRSRSEGLERTYQAKKP